MPHPIVAGNTPQTEPENRVFYPALDGLRTVAVTMVFLEHYAVLPWGWTGVDIFFVLSGFLITGILLDTRDDAHRARNFYVRRTLRIFPLYYAICLGVLAAAPFMHWHLRPAFLAWPAYLGNFLRYVHPAVQGDAWQRLSDAQLKIGGDRDSFLFFGHFWSLCIEEQFYLIWPWVVFSVRSRRALLWICALSLPVCLALRLAAPSFLPAWMIGANVQYRATPFRLDALLCGGLLALLIRGAYRERCLRLARRAFLPLLAVALLWAFGPSARHHMHMYPYPPWVFTWGETGIELLAALAVLVTLQPGTWLYRGLSIKPLRWVGRISYGVYIFHDIPHSLYVQMSKHFVGHELLFTNLFAATGTLLLAWLSYRFFESPFLNLKERWTVR